MSKKLNDDDCDKTMTSESPVGGQNPIGLVTISAALDPDCSALEVAQHFVDNHPQYEFVSTLVTQDPETGIQMVDITLLHREVV